MSKEKIVPHKVTRPMQLLAAWLVSLLALEGALLTAAGTLSTPSWAPGALVVTAIVIIPLFVGALFLLLTKYRKELLDDKYYSEDQQRKDELLNLQNLLNASLNASTLEPEVKDILLNRISIAQAETNEREIQS